MLRLQHKLDGRYTLTYNEGTPEMTFEAAEIADTPSHIMREHVSTN